MIEEDNLAWSMDTGSAMVYDADRIIGAHGALPISAVLASGLPAELDGDDDVHGDDYALFESRISAPAVPTSVTTEERNGIVTSEIHQLGEKSRL